MFDDTSGVAHYSSVDFSNWPRSWSH
jgi:hypothetical protein